MNNAELIRRAKHGEVIGDGAEQIALLVARVAKLEDFARDVYSNYDCDQDDHKYETGCRCCNALAVLTECQS